MTLSAIAVPKLPFDGLHHGRRREHAGLVQDVAADHHRGADLRDDGPEAGHHRGQQRQSGLPHEEPDHLPSAGAEREDLEPEPGVELLDRRGGEPRDDRRGDDRLGDDHRRRRVEKVKEAEGAVPPEHDHHDEADDDRRQPHPCVDEAEDEAPPGKARQRERRPERDPDDAG